MAQKLTALSATLLALAVLFGAFGAHALKGVLDEHAKEIYQTGVTYQFRHSFGILAVAIMERVGMLTAKTAKFVAVLFTIGIIVFSGSLYALVLSGHSGFGAITPIGGVLFITGWITLAVAAWRRSQIV